jgi:hypothetical protein
MVAWHRFALPLVGFTAAALVVTAGSSATATPLTVGMALTGATRRAVKRILPADKTVTRSGWHNLGEKVKILLFPRSRLTVKCSDARGFARI